jgi:DNA repair protein RadC
MEPSAPAGTLRCRQILVDLLRPFGPDARRSADRLIGAYGSLGGVLAAGPEAQTRILGTQAAAVRHLGTIREAMLHALRCDAFAGPVLGDSQALLTYLTFDMAHLPTERLRILYLNSANRLLCDDAGPEGSVNATRVLPRAIMRRAVEVGATALILGHNQPSGDPTPSRDDVEATRRIADAARALDICIHDHVIVAGSAWTSFRALGLLRAAA